MEVLKILHVLKAMKPSGEYLVPFDVLVAYMASVQFGIIVHWIESGRKQTPQEIALMISRILYHGVFRSAGFVH